VESKLATKAERRWSTLMSASRERSVQERGGSEVHESSLA